MADIFDSYQNLKNTIYSKQSNQKRKGGFSSTTQGFSSAASVDDQNQPNISSTPYNITSPYKNLSDDKAQENISKGFKNIENLMSKYSLGESEEDTDTGVKDIQSRLGKSVQESQDTSGTPYDITSPYKNLSPDKSEDTTEKKTEDTIELDKEDFKVDIEREEKKDPFTPPSLQKNISNQFQNIDDLMSKYQLQTEGTTPSILDKEEKKKEKKEKKKIGVEPTEGIGIKSTQAPLTEEQKETRREVKDTIVGGGPTYIDPLTETLGGPETYAEATGEKLVGRIGEGMTEEQTEDAYEAIRSTAGIYDYEDPEVIKDYVSFAVGNIGDDEDREQEINKAIEKWDEMSTGQKQEWAAIMSKDTMDFMDRMEKLKENPENLLAFVKGAKDIKKFGDLASAAKKLNEGKDLSNEELLKLKTFFDKSQRDRTWGYNVASIVAEMPAFAQELGVSAGISKAVREGGKLALRKIARGELTDVLSSRLKKEGLEETINKYTRETLEEGTEGVLERRTSREGLEEAAARTLTYRPRLIKKSLKDKAKKGAGIAVDVSTRPAVAGITRIPANTARKQVGQHVKEHMTGEEAEDYLSSFLKAASEQYVEVGSEYSGLAFLRGAPFLRKIVSKATPTSVKNAIYKTSVWNALKKVNPGTGTGKLRKALSTVGWHGPFAEMGEERVASVAHGALSQVGLSDQEFEWPTWGQIAAFEWPNWGQIAAEATAFMIPGVGISMLERSKNAISDIDKKLGEPQTFDISEEERQRKEEEANKAEEESNALLQIMGQAANVEEFTQNIKQKSQKIIDDYKGEESLGSSENVNELEQQIEANPEVSRASQILLNNYKNSDGTVTVFKGTQSHTDAGNIKTGWTIDLDVAKDQAAKNKGKIVSARVPIEDVAFYDSPALRQEETPTSREVVLKNTNDLVESIELDISDYDYVGETYDDLGYAPQDLSNYIDKEMGYLQNRIQPETELSDIYESPMEERAEAEMRRQERVAVSPTRFEEDSVERDMVETAKNYDSYDSFYRDNLDSLRAENIEAEARNIWDEAQRQTDQRQRNIRYSRAGQATNVPIEENVVIQIRDERTGTNRVKTIPKGKLSIFRELIGDNVNYRIGGEKINGKTYHITARSPESMQERGFVYDGVASINELKKSAINTKVRNSLSLSNFEITSENGANFSYASSNLINRVAKALNTNIIIDRAQFNEKLDQYTQYRNDIGEIYGFTDGENIYLNPDSFNDSTLLHEGSHLWWDLIKQENRDFYERARGVIQNSDYYSRIETERPDIENEETKIDEALALAVQDYSDIKTRQGMAQNVLDLVKDFWRAILDFFGIQDKSLHLYPEMMNEASIQDLADIVYSQLTNGVPLNKATSQTVYGNSIMRIRNIPEDGGIEVDPIRYSGEFKLSSKGQKLGFNTRWEELAWDRYSNIKKEANGDVNEFKNLIDEKLDSLYKEIKDGKHVIRSFSRQVLESEKQIAREHGQGEAADQYQRILDGDTQLERRSLEEFKESQQQTLNRWTRYFQDAPHLDNSFKYLVLKELTEKVDRGGEIKQRTENTMTGFPPLNEAALAEWYNEGTTPGFHGEYSEIAKEQRIQQQEEGEVLQKGDVNGKWIVLPQDSDPTVLSEYAVGTNWCIRAESTAKSYIEGGDFHLFLTKDKKGRYSIPRVAIAMKDGEVSEVRGRAEQQNLESGMEEIAEERYHSLPGGERYDKKFNDMKKLTEIERKDEAGEELSIEELKFLYEIENEIDGFGFNKDPRIEEIKNRRDTKEDYAKIYNIEKEGIVLEDELSAGNEELDGKRMVIGDLITTNKLGDIEYVTGDLRITSLTEARTEEGTNIENLGKIKEVGGKLMITDVSIKSFKDLERVGGDIEISEGTGLEDVGNLRSVGGEFDFRGTDIKNLKNIEYLGKAIFNESNVEDLGSLQEIGGGADFSNSKIEDLKNLKIIRGSAAFRDSNIKRLGKLEYIEGAVNLENSSLEDIGNLKRVDDDFVVSNTNLKSLQNLEKIGRNAIIADSNVENLGKLEEVGASLTIHNTPLSNLENLKTIGGDAIFDRSNLKTLNNLEKVGGTLSIRGTQVKDLGNVKKISGSLNLSSNITSLDNIEYVGNTLDLRDTQVKDLGDLKEVGEVLQIDNSSKIKSLQGLEKVGYLKLSNSKVSDLGNLKEVTGDLDLSGNKKIKSLQGIERVQYNLSLYQSAVQDLGELKEVGGSASFERSKVKSLNKLSFIGGDAVFSNSDVKDLGELKEIFRNIYLLNSKIKSLQNIESIGGDLSLPGSNVESLGNLKTIRGRGLFANSNVKDLGGLKIIAGDASFRESKVESLGELKNIGGKVDFTNSNVENTGQLETIGRDAIFANSKIKSLGNIERIRGNLNLINSNVKDLGELKSIGEDLIIDKTSPLENLGSLETVRSINLSETKVKDLGNLKRVFGDIVLTDSPVKSLNNLNIVLGNAIFNNSQVEDLGNLGEVSGVIELKDSNIKDLKNLKKIGGVINFKDTPVESLGKLETVYNSVFFNESNVKDLGDLRVIHGTALFSNSPIESLQNIETIKRGANFVDSNVKDVGNLQEIDGGAVVDRDANQEFIEQLKNVGARIVYPEEGQTKTAEEVLEANITSERAQDILSNIFPNNEVEFLTTGFIGYGQEGGQIYGRYTNAFIEVVETGGNVSDQVVYHEAFHAYTDMFMSQEEKDIIKEEMRAQHKEDVNERGWEEVAADEFANYVAGRRTVSQQVADLFSRITRRIRKFMDMEPSVRDIYNDIIEGEAGRRQEREPSLDEKDKESFQILTNMREKQLDDTSYNGEYTLPPEENDTSAVGPPYQQSELQGFTRWEKAKRGIYWRNFREKVEDSNIMLKQLGKEIKMAAGKERLEEHEDIWRQKDMLPRKSSEVFRRSRDRKRKLIQGLLQDGLTFEEMDEYLKAKHAEERNEKMKEYRRENPQAGEVKEGLSGMMTEDAQKILEQKKQEGKAEALEKHAEEIYSINDETLQMQVDAGLMPQTVADQLNEAYDYYVPLYRDVDEEAWTGIGAHMDIKGQEELMAEGSERQVKSVIASSFFKYERAQVRALKNDIGKNIVETTRTYDFLEQVFTIEKQRFTPRFDADGEITHLEKRPVQGKQIIGTKINGEQYFIHVHDSEVYQALVDMKISKIPWFFRGLNTLVRVFSMLKTKYTPGFLITNFERDISEALINLGVEAEMLSKEERKKLRRTIVKDLPKSQKELYNHLRKGETTKEVDDFFRLGGDVGRMWGEDVVTAEEDLHKLQKQLQGGGMQDIKNIIRGVDEWIDNMQTVVELGIRFSTYKELVNRGFSKENAIQSAADLTVNFSRQGTISPWLKMLWAFINPAFQGTSKVIRSTTSSVGRKKIMQSIAGLYALGFMTRMFSIMMSGDDDQKISQWEKNHRIVFSIGGHKFTLWNMPYGYNTFFAMGSGTADWAYGHITEKEVLTNTIKTAANSFSPFGGSQLSDMLPTLYKPMHEIYMNENWYDSKVYPEQIYTRTPKPEHEVYFESATSLSKNITEILYQMGIADIHPESLQYAFDQYVGGPLEFVQSSIGAVASGTQGKFKPEEVPLLREFYSKVNDEAVYDIVFSTLRSARKSDISDLEEGRFMWALEDGIKNDVFNLAKANRYKEDYYKGRTGKIFSDIKDLPNEEKAKAYERIRKNQAKEISTRVLDKLKEQKAEEIYEEMKGMTEEQNKRRFQRIKNKYPDVAKYIKEIHKKNSMSKEEKGIKELRVENGDRAQKIFDKLRRLDGPQERRKMKREYMKKGIITDQVAEQLNKLEQEQGYSD